MHAKGDGAPITRFVLDGCRYIFNVDVQIFILDCSGQQLILVTMWSKFKLVQEVEDLEF